MSRKKRSRSACAVRGLAESLEARRLLANDFAVGPNPAGVVSADFNGDGRPDLATANNNASGTVSILLGKADGTFNAAASVSAGASADALVAGDFNKDLKVDLAVANYNGSATNNVSVLVGNGDGTFAPAVAYSTGRPYPAAIVTGDFNGDGDLDLAAVNYNVFGTVSVLAGAAAATFSAATIVNVGDQSKAITTGDFNADGKLDLATVGTTASGTVSVVPGNGNGTFGTLSSVATLPTPQAVVAGDFNGDGKTDLATAGRNGTTGLVQILRNNGNNTFTAIATPVVASNPAALVAADFDADGTLDLATANDSATNTVSVVRNSSVATFTVTNYTFGPGPLSLVAADVNGDGRVDLATANKTNATVSVRLGLGYGNLVDGLFAPAATLAGPATPGPTVSADFDNDGLLDLAVSSNGNPGLVRVYKGAGNGTFTVIATYTVGAAVSGIVAADFNGDGNLDLATAAGLFNGSVSILSGVGNCQFAAGPTLTGVTQPTAIATGDFNGDGKADLAVSNFVLSGTVQRWLGNGDGTFGPSTLTGLAGGQYPRQITSGDFNNDGRTDLATANASTTGATVTALSGNADGTFTVTAGPVLGGKGYSAALGEFTGDGNADLAVGTDANGGRYFVLPGNGAGGFASAAAAASPGVIAYAMLAGDFNNDGKTDIAAANSSQLAVLLGNGAGQVAAVPPVPAAAALNVAAGDFNGDGRLDLIGTGTVSTNLTVALNQVPLPSIPAVTGGLFNAYGPSEAVLVNAGVLKVTYASGVVEYYNASAVREYRTNYPLTVNSDLGRSGGLGNVAVTAYANSAVTFNASQHLTTLSLDPGARVALSAGRKLLRVKSLTGLGGNVYLDLNDSDLIYDYTSGTPHQSAIRTAIGTARAGGSWTGYGLTSTAAKTDAAGRTTLGYIEATDYQSIYGANATFAGEAIDSTAVLVTYTLYGDADLNKAVNFNDYLRLQSGFGQTGKGFTGGDFDDDNDTDFNDFLALQANFGLVV